MLLFRKSPGTTIWGDLWPEQTSFLNRLFIWHITLMIYLLELFGIGEVYETLTDLVKFNTRAMTEREISVARSIYGNQINYRRVRLDAYAYLGPRQQNICYVSFYLINSWGNMSDALLIHELVHIWQYEQMGAIYMPCARGDLRTFNLEQQGDIVADYFRIRNGQTPEWGNGLPKHLAIYAAIVRPALGVASNGSELPRENDMT